MKQWNITSYCALYRICIRIILCSYINGCEYWISFLPLIYLTVIKLSCKWWCFENHQYIYFHNVCCVFIKFVESNLDHWVLFCNRWVKQNQGLNKPIQLSASIQNILLSNLFINCAYMSFVFLFCAWNNCFFPLSFFLLLFPPCMYSLFDFYSPRLTVPNTLSSVMLYL